MMRQHSKRCILLIQPVPLLKPRQSQAPCLLAFIKRSRILVGLQPNQTGPLNIAGGLEGEGNDLGFHHTSLETETHHRWTDGRTDKSRGGEPTTLLVLSPLHPLRKKVKHWLCRPQPTHPPIAAFVGTSPPPVATGGPKATSYGSSFTLVCSWPTPHPLPSLSLQLGHSASITYSDLLFLALCFLVSLPQGFLGKQHLGHLLPSKGPLGRPCQPSTRDSHSCSTLFEVRG